jgi:hypothetical protein
MIWLFKMVIFKKNDPDICFVQVISMMGKWIRWFMMDDHVWESYDLRATLDFRMLISWVNDTCSFRSKPLISDQADMIEIFF